MALADAADALGVRQLGPGIFIGPSDLAFDQQVLKAGNFKATLVFDIKLPHQTSDSGISRFTMNTSCRLLLTLSYCQSAQAFRQSSEC